MFRFGLLCRNLQPTTWYGDFTVAFFGSIAVVLISVFGGIVFSHLVSVKALIKFSDKAVISNYALDGRNYFQFKIYGVCLHMHVPACSTAACSIFELTTRFVSRTMAARSHHQCVSERVRSCERGERAWFVD